MPIAYGLGFEAFLEEVSDASVLVVVVIDVGGRDALHDFADGFSVLLDEQVYVISHLTVGVYDAMGWLFLSEGVFLL